MAEMQLVEAPAQATPEAAAQQHRMNTPMVQMDESVNEPEDATCELLLDAKNGFNKLSRKAAFWTNRHRWPAGAWYAFNCYRHSA